MRGATRNEFLFVPDSIREALDTGQPVVALETTLVTHGFPSNEGLDLALELERIVRAEGATAATIGVLDGCLIVGLTPDQINRLALSSTVVKLNPSNLAAGITSGQPGSTTVAATMRAANMTGIQVLATGGIGGVHRNAESTGDISADLTALGRLPVAVVCSGAKAILDLPRTLEALETAGVPVFGNHTERFPAFFRRDSGLPLDRSFESVEALSNAIQTHFALAPGTGVIIANPIADKYEMQEAIYEQALEQSLMEADRKSLRGREVTPFLLARMREHTDLESSFSNKHLLRSNAQLAAQLACALMEE